MSELIALEYSRGLPDAPPADRERLSPALEKIIDEITREEPHEILHTDIDGTV